MSLSAARVVLIIPAFNEAQTIQKVLDGVMAYRGDLLAEIVVVDDASSDETRAIVESVDGITLLEHTTNQGYGAAQRTGHLYAIENDYDYVVQCDADGQHDPRYIPELLETAVNDGYDILLGSRFCESDESDAVNTVRKTGIQFFSAVVRYFGDVEIEDVTSGFKVYSTDVLEQLDRPNDRHPAVHQVLEASINEFAVGEYPVEMNEREYGSSHLDTRGLIAYPIRMIEFILSAMIFRRHNR